MDKITVITVTYNAAATLENTILSVINQSYPAIELLIIDGASTDNTINIIRKYEHKLACWISEKDDGIYHAMNKGIKAGTGDWVIFLGADDIFFDDGTLASIFNETPDKTLDLLYGDVILKSNKKIYGGSRTYDQMISNNINHQSIFYRKTLFTTTGTFNLKYKILADYEFNLRIFRQPLLKTKYMRQVITLFNDKGLSNQVIDGNFYEDQLEYFLKVDGIPPKDYRLQTYYFFYGFAQFIKTGKIKGLKTILYSLTFGRRKFYYFLVSIKYFLSLLGFGRRIRALFVPHGQLSEH